MWLTLNRRGKKVENRNNDSTKRVKAFAKLNSNGQFWCETKTFSKDNK